MSEKIELIDEEFYQHGFCIGLLVINLEANLPAHFIPDNNDLIFSAGDLQTIAGLLNEATEAAKAAAGN